MNTLQVHNIFKVSKPYYVCKLFKTSSSLKISFCVSHNKPANTKLFVYWISQFGDLCFMSVYFTWTFARKKLITFDDTKNKRCLNINRIAQIRKGNQVNWDRFTLMHSVDTFATSICFSNGTDFVWVYQLSEDNLASENCICLFFKFAVWFA